jgi:hypothetical protein
MADPSSEGTSAATSICVAASAVSTMASPMHPPSADAMMATINSVPVRFITFLLFYYFDVSP